MAKSVEVEKLSGACPGCGKYQLLKVHGRTGWFTVAKAKAKLATAKDTTTDEDADDDAGVDDKPDDDAKPGVGRGFWD